MTVANKIKQVFTPNPTYAFNKGYQEITDPEKAFEVKFELMRLLCITSDGAWNRRLKGCHALSWQLKEDITSLFRRFGVDDPWGL